VPCETVTIKLSKLEPYEAAAQLLSVIAYPDDQKGRRQFSNAICGWTLGQSWQDPELSSAPISAPPAYWEAASTSDGSFNRGMLVINRKALIAAKQASQVVAAFLNEPVNPLRPTNEKVLDAISKDLRQRKRRETRGDRKGNKETVADKYNVMKRISKPNRPVLHLCVAMHMTIHHLSPNQQDLNLGDLMRITTLSGIIGIAHTIAPVMLPCFGIKPGEQIEVVAS
jgi:hypothetical protein